MQNPFRTRASPRSTGLNSPGINYTVLLGSGYGAAGEPGPFRRSSLHRRSAAGVPTMGGTDTGVTGWGILTLHACLRPTVRSTGARPRNCLDCLFGVAVTGLGLKLAWSTVGRKTDHAARARVCDLLTGSACGQFSGTLLYWLHHWWCNIMI